MEVAIDQHVYHSDKWDRSGRNTTSVTVDRETPWDEDERMCVIRRVFSSGGERDRDAAIAELVREFGVQRESRIGETVDNAIRTAVRRGVLANEKNLLSLGAHSIEDYERDFLKEQFLASTAGRTWTEREDAIRSFARWLGFRRTGPSIEDASRSLINGLLREGRLEAEGSRIRKPV